MLHQQVSRSHHCGFVGVYALAYATINGTRTDALRRLLYIGWHDIIKSIGDPYDATSVAAVHAAAVEVCNPGGADGWCQTSILDSNTPSLSFYFSKIFHLTRLSLSIDTGGAVWEHVLLQCGAAGPVPFASISGGMLGAQTSNFGKERGSNDGSSARYVFC